MRFLDSKGLEYFYNKLKGVFPSLSGNNTFRGVNTFRDENKFLRKITIAATDSLINRSRDFSSSTSMNVCIVDLTNSGIPSTTDIEPLLCFEAPSSPNSARCCVLILKGTPASVLNWKNCVLLCEPPAKEANKTLIVTLLFTKDENSKDTAYVVSSVSGEEV